MDDLAPVLILIVIFAAIFGIIYVYLMTRNKERMALIDKGADASMFNTGKERRFFGALATLKTGMFLLGIALGILIGNIFAEYTRLDETVCYFSMIFLFGGLSLVIYYFYVNSKKD